MWYLQVENSDFSGAMWSYLIICLIAMLAAVTVVLLQVETLDFSWAMW
jgi:hypothetical protein